MAIFNKFFLNRKMIIILVLVFLIIIANIFFWVWTKKNSEIDSLIVTNEGLVKKGWQKFIETNAIEFEVPNILIRDNSLTGIYWFDPTAKRVAILYERFSRDKTLSLEKQVEANILQPRECAGQVVSGDFTIYKACPYLQTVFTFAVFEQNDKLAVVSMDHRYLEEADINHLIQTLKKQ